MNLSATSPSQANARVEAQQFVYQIGYDAVDICTSAIELAYRRVSFVHNEKQLLEKQHNEHLSS